MNQGEDYSQYNGVILETSVGEIEIELYYKHAPLTCKNFYLLAKTGKYNNVIFHRVIRGFMIQGGDPTGNIFIINNYILKFLYIIV